MRWIPLSYIIWRPKKMNIKNYNKYIKNKNNKKIYMETKMTNIDNRQYQVKLKFYSL